MNKRGSGILLHVTSLPSPYGIGDLGPSAYRFVDFLCESEQKFWQILPLNPTSPAYDNSPYMSSSAFAGNTNLISPELLVRDGFLEKNDCESVPEFPQDRVDYTEVILYKRILFSRAYGHRGEEIQKDHHYLEFCREHAWWLEDYAVFQALTRYFRKENWNTWPDTAKFRRNGALDEIKSLTSSSTRSTLSTLSPLPTV
jgi:4-alpha-glucanotransferase